MKLDNDFSNLLHESKSERFFEKIKPLFKVTAVVAVLIGLVYGGVLLFGTGTKPADDSSYTASSIVNEDNEKLYDCLVGVIEKQPTPEASDPNFYPKLIGNYDTQLACYDQYPNGNNVVSRSSIEYARENAIGSSGDYKNAYTASNGSSSGTHTNTTAGCEYSLSESEYLKCTDRYNSANSKPSSSTNSTNTPSYTPPPSTPPTPSNPPGNTGGSSSGTGQSDPYAALNACLAEARSLPTEASRARAVQGCYQNHTP